ncbi:hypothetical protein MLD38_028354 [Melastoma candidum]|uniref:Uncharacterized protein n=1 Tax=Melastoma candidum TaxID=119954 RepID=A0ACB9N0J0_9MYRT|nr:hypothetical protein MLD38_028354 [Melastoma candidum]
MGARSEVVVSANPRRFQGRFHGFVTFSLATGRQYLSQRAKHKTRNVLPFRQLDKGKRRERSQLHFLFGYVGTLELQIREVVDAMIDCLRTLSREADGQFLAIDLRVEMLEKQKTAGGRKVVLMLRKCLISSRKSGKGYAGGQEVEVPGITGLGVRESDRLQRLLREQRVRPGHLGLVLHERGGQQDRLREDPDPRSLLRSASATEHISPFVKKKNHVAYSCFC